MPSHRSLGKGARWQITPMGLELLKAAYDINPKCVHRRRLLKPLPLIMLRKHRQEASHGSQHDISTQYLTLCSR